MKQAEGQNNKTLLWSLNRLGVSSPEQRAVNTSLCTNLQPVFGPPSAPHASLLLVHQSLLVIPIPKLSSWQMPVCLCLAAEAIAFKSYRKLCLWCRLLQPAGAARCLHERTGSQMQAGRTRKLGCMCCWRCWMTSVCSVPAAMIWKGILSRWLNVLAV